MVRFIWILSICTIPLLMVRYFKIVDIPVTFIFVLPIGLLHTREIIRSKKIQLDKYFLIFFGLFIVISTLDLARSLDFDSQLLFPLKVFIQLLTFIYYKHFILKYRLMTFVRVLSISSAIFLLYLIYQSLIVMKAPFFVVDKEIITETGKNQLAFYLAIIIPMIFWFLIKNKNSRTWKILLSASLLIHLFGAIYVQSKGLVFALIIGIFVSAFAYNLIKFNIKSVLKVIVVLLIGVYLFNTFNLIDIEEFKQDLIALFNSSSEASNSSDERLGLLELSKEEFYSNPFFGIGTNNFAAKHHLATHNNYMQILCENGFFVFILLIFLLYNVYKNIRRYKIPTYPILISLSIFLSLFIYFFVINALFTAIAAIGFSIISSTLNLNEYPNEK